MRCSSCGIDNVEGSRFCNQCATPLDKECPSCRFENLRGARFCSQCSFPFESNHHTLTEPQPTSRVRDGERRHLTILFCDLVGSVTLASQVDPEEWRATVADYQRAASEAITRFGGEVMRYVGDGIMAFFGYPIAHDNDAERAVRAGLTILGSIVQLNQQPTHPKLSVRIGIDSGPVVVGAGAGKDVDAFGDTANIAARVQAAADPATVVVTGKTHRLISGLFVVEDRGPQTFKGIERPVQLYRVIRQSGMRGRFEAAVAAGGLTPFVGREDELRLLLNRWERAREGEGQVVTIIGEAGIGKSRLVRCFREQIADTPHTWIEAGASAFFHSTPFYPVSEMLQQVLGDVPPQGQITQLASRLTATGLKPAESIPLLAPMLSLPLPKGYPPSTLPPEQQRRRLLANLVEWVLGSARTQPLVSVIEDLHWIDPSTRELIQLLVEQGVTAPILLVYTARPEFHPPWPLRAHHTQITLNRLNARHVRTMVGEVAAQKALSDETVAMVVERTGGVPLFVEELTRAVLESGDGKLSGRAIPVTLHDSLMARLDRLESAKEVAQIGAVIGSEFSYELLHAVCRVPETELQCRLEELTDAELLYVRGFAPDATYQFKHALIRDAAYEGLLKSRRHHLHEQIAGIIETRFPEVTRSQPELLAYHCTEAGMVEQAVRYWRRAGRAAIQRSANTEAITNLSKGLELIEALPVSSATLLEKLKLQMALTTPLIAIKGYTAPEVEQTCNRALDLCQQIGDSPYLFGVLGGLNSIYFNRCELDIALALAGRMFKLSEITRDRASQLWAHYALGFTLALQGRLRSARDHLERSLAFYDRAKSGTYGYVQDPGPTAMAMLSRVVHLLGYPDQALKWLQQSLALARSLGHPFTLAWVLGFAGELYWKLGERSAARQCWTERVAISSEQGFKQMLESARFSLGFLTAEESTTVGATAPLSELCLRYGSVDVDDVPFPDKVAFLGLLALAQGKAGEPGEALLRLDQALALAKKSGQHDLCALYIFQGQLLLMKNPGGSRKAKQSLRMAIQLAREMHAKSQELSAAIHFGRLLRQEGRMSQAHAVVSKIYNWFTEGFDTADLKDAKALLEELEA